MSSQTPSTENQLALLAEVCCELGQAALKLSRSGEYDDIPASRAVSEEYIRFLIVEITDARNVFNSILREGLMRWAQRHGQKKG